MSLRQDLLDLLKTEEGGLSENELASRLKLPKHLRKRVRQALEELLEKGDIRRDSRHRYQSKSHARRAGVNLGAGSAPIQATFILSSQGSAFAKIAGQAQGQAGDYFIPDRYRGWALPGDLVELRLLPRRPGDLKRGLNQAAAVQRVVKRGRDQYVGCLSRQGRQAFLVLTVGESEIDLELKGVPPAVPEGDWIVAGPPGLDTDGREPEPALFQSHLGGEGTAHLDTLILIKKAGLKEEFSPAALAEARLLPSQPGPADFAGRLDLRKEIVFTIDGADAKDFDDAVSLSRTRDGWHLGVHIADVSHYVRPGTALDKEAYERATSVYLPDRVLPMLPEELSNGLCSLKPDVPRLCESAIMDFDNRGEMVSFKFADSVIHSSRRFTYDEVEAWLERREGLTAQEAPILGPVLDEMKRLTLKRQERRSERGALDFNFPEVKAELDAKGIPIRLFRRARLFSNQLIEEFMLAANEAVAKELTRRGAGLLYRIHEQPDEEKLAATLAVLGKLKLGAPHGGNITPKDLQKILSRVEGKKEERFVHTLVLRSLRLARYAPIHDIHFGLALADYCHFTSPIRRYPDLVVHRALRAAVMQGQDKGAVKQLMGDLVGSGEHCSFMERKAEGCERECIKAKQIRYLEGRLGEEFEAMITSVANFGFFAEIIEFPAEGLVPMGSLSDDYYVFDPEWQKLEGRRTGRSYSIGDKLKIKVKRADWKSLQADFEVIPLDE